MEIFENVVYQLGLLAAFILGILCAAHALLHKREPSSALIWVAICFSIPVVGSLLYVLFGVNRIHRHATKLMLRSRKLARPGNLSSPADGDGGKPGQCFHPQDDGEDKIFYPPQEEHAHDHCAEFPMEVPAALLPAKIRTMARIGYSVMGMPLLAGNKVEILYNGNEAYPAMLEAIAGAEHSIYLDTYIFDSDEVGMAFVDALAQAAARGVEVRVQVDGTGTLLTRPRIDKVLRSRGVTVGRFIPPRLFPPQLSINLRNHRKLLLVDGRLGFTGGMNISSMHMLKPVEKKGLLSRLGLSGPNQMQDIHFRVQGPILEDFQRIFAREWQFTTGEMLELPQVSIKPQGYSLCRTILDGPDDYLERFHSTLLGAISAAKNSVRIMTPYFLPPRPLITALQSAAMRGLDVAIILPEEMDHRVVKWATTNVLWEFLGRGIHIYYQPAPFNHSKLLLIDGYYAHVGSANLDARSLRLNFELTMEVFDLHVAGELERHFAEVRAKSRECTLEEINARSLPEKMRDAAFWLISPYM
ncbi:phospholipase D-like domain-containing protein [Desulfovibrio sp. OttesenSCG-928-C06]|nr:phospholipase D-like domain-containing protein [Desulfovibrio sp. OttesenSCG-928-C06]